MKLIYEAKGRAWEYSPTALNIYKGCDHGCKYCYVPSVTFRKDANQVPQERKALLQNLEKELSVAVPKERIFLSFLCDPYSRHDIEAGLTREVLHILLSHQCKVSILTKGGYRCMRDLDLFKRFDDIRVGATLTFSDNKKSLEWEPKAALPEGRTEALRILSNAGISTWASIEPVIEPKESLEIISRSLPFVDHYKVGKLNHNKVRESTIDWPGFLGNVVTLLRAKGKSFYIKEDLRKAAPDIVLTKEETSMELPI